MWHLATEFVKLFNENLPCTKLLNFLIFPLDLLHSLQSCSAREHCCLFLIVHVLALVDIREIPDLRKTRHESSGDVTIYRMEQGLSDGTGFINCYLDCWKFTCLLHFDNTCTISNLFQ